jgi:DNA invertase Pin-like site-specific DNA recombinase
MRAGGRINGLAEDERQICDALLGRLEKGRREYGPWRIDDGRDYPSEAYAEVLDGLHYIAAELVRRRRREVARRRRVYVCHPFAFDPAGNIAKVRAISQALLVQGVVPIAPHLYRAIQEGLSTSGLDVVEATVLRRELLRAYVERLEPDDDVARERLYQRLKRQRSRAMQRLKSLLTIAGEELVVGLVDSLDSQYESCLAYIERTPGWTLVDDRYDDGGFTGANIDRPAFKRLMADVEAGKVDVIVVYKVDRRSLLDFMKVIERLNAVGASFVSITQNFSTADAMGRLTMTMLMSFAEFEREMVSERTRDKIANARRKGKWTGGPVPFGYSAKDKKLVVNEAEAHVVREAFALLLAHRQMAVVARELNQRGLLPRTTKRTHKRGALWTKDGIARVLRSPLYAGQMMYGDELFRGEQPPLVDGVTYRQAQELVGEGGRELRVTGQNPEYVLRGLLGCGSCGEAMTPASTTKRSGKSYRFYRCSTRDKFGKRQCSGRPLPAKAIEDFVFQRITEATADGTLAQRVADKLTARLAKDRKRLADVRAALAVQIAEAVVTTNKLMEDLSAFEGRARQVVEDKLRIEAAKLADAERRQRAAERDVESLADAEHHRDWFVGALRNFGKVWGGMTPVNRGRLLRALVAKVSVDEESGVCRVELVNFDAAVSTTEAA